MNPDIPPVQLYDARASANITDEELREVKKYAIGIGPDYRRIDRDAVERAHRLGLKIHPYTVNSEEEMRLIGWGVGRDHHQPSRSAAPGAEREEVKRDACM